jgi:hypothetical protein
VKLASISFSLAAGLLAAAGCIDLPGSGGTDDDLTSVGGDEYIIDYDGYVDVAPGASDEAVKGVIHRQLKSALGALREQGIGVADRDAVRNLANPTLTRTRVTVVQPGGAVRNELDRVRYHYHDQALVEKGHGTTSPISLTLLYGDYIANAGSLIPICSDDQTTDGDSLWYHYQPNLSACKAAIVAEQRAIDHDREALTSDLQIPASDADRKFLTTRATLVKATAAPDKWPEHDALWGFAGDTSRTKLVVYSFFGVDSDINNPGDSGLVEYMRFERELRKRMPKLAVTETSPNAWLLDYYVDGQKLPNITWDTVERWIVDGTGFPASVANDPAKKADLLRQVIASFSDRWIVWSAPMTITKNGVTRNMTLEIRTWHGFEDGSPDIRQRARWRYLEAFWHADVFAYTGHSHFGHGPLEPWEYSSSNFPDRYQVMLFNSCLSYNYYDEDFLRMHPGGTQKLDVVVNGLPAYWMGMGGATAAYIAGITGGAQSWRQLLTGMRVNLPWQSGYDPMRAVNGELDNQFSPSAGSITVQ